MSVVLPARFDCVVIVDVEPGRGVGLVGEAEPSGDCILAEDIREIVIREGLH